MTCTRKKWRKWALRLVALALGYQLLALLLQRPALFMGAQVTLPSTAPPADATILQLGTTAVTEAWYLPPATVDDGPHAALLFAHGNGELIDDYPPAFDAPRRWGMGVLLVEYPGFGRSPGSPTEATLRAAVVAGYDWLAQREDVDASRIVAMGRSLGGGAIGQLSRERKPAALVLVSTFASFASLLPRFGVPPVMARDNFDTVDALNHYHGAVFVAHGRRDMLIPFEHATRLAAAGKVTVHVMPGGHNDNPLPWESIRPFLQQAGLIAQAP